MVRARRAEGRIAQVHTVKKFFSTRLGLDPSSKLKVHSETSIGESGELLYIERDSIQGRHERHIMWHEVC